MLALPGAGYADDEGEQELIMLYERTLELLDQSQRALLENGQRAWLDYRDASCALYSERDEPAQATAAREACFSFMTGERALDGL